MPFKTFGVGDVLTAADVNNYLMKQTIITCTSGTRPSSPVEGMTIFETDTDLNRYWDGSAWTTLGSAARTAVSNVQNSLFQFTATSFGVTTTGGTYADCGEVFVAPWSGRVLISWSASQTSSTTGVIFISPVVRTGGTVGSGTVVLAASDDIAVVNAGTTSQRAGCQHLLTGLTNGTTYNVRLEHRTNTGTANASSRSVAVIPTT